MKVSSKTSGGIQEIKHKRHDAATHKHGYRAKDPQEEREGEVKCSQSNRPKQASTIQVSSNIVYRFCSVYEGGNSSQEANMSIVSDRLDIAKKSHEKA